MEFGSSWGLWESISVCVCVCVCVWTYTLLMGEKTEMSNEASLHCFTKEQLYHNLIWKSKLPSSVVWWKEEHCIFSEPKLASGHNLETRCDNDTSCQLDHTVLSWITLSGRRVFGMTCKQRVFLWSSSRGHVSDNRGALSWGSLNTQHTISLELTFSPPSLIQQFKCFLWSWKLHVRGTNYRL